MSTETTYFKLHKPERSDPADITAMNENWDKIDQELARGSKVVTATKGADGLVGNYQCSKYNATVEGIDELYSGLELIVVPNLTNTTTNVTLNVNGLGDVFVGTRSLYSAYGNVAPLNDEWFLGGYPMKLTYNKLGGGSWLCDLVMTPAPIERYMTLYDEGYYYIEFCNEQDVDGTPAHTSLFGATFYWKPGTMTDHRNLSHYGFVVSTDGKISSYWCNEPFDTTVRYERIM